MVHHSGCTALSSAGMLVGALCGKQARSQGLSTAPRVGEFSGSPSYDHVKRADLEHIIRAAATIAADDELIIVGSQSVLAQFPDAPEEMLRSDEADVYPKNKPERWELIDGAIGELSLFHDTFGYYAQGVEEGVATLPRGWKDRLIPLSTPATRGATGFCLELHDLLISKYVANREKDRRYCRAAANAGLAQRDILDKRLAATELDTQVRDLVSALIVKDFSTGGARQ